MKTVPHIVIVGCGFGGTYVAGALLPHVRRGELAVTVINATNYFLFTPLLHEVATGALGPLSVVEPLREIFAGTDVRIVEGEVDSLDAAARVLRVGGRELSYDCAVIATGAETDYYGIPGAQEHAHSLKSLPDALAIRDAVIASFARAASLNGDARAKALRFVVVGGGATGVELAAELVEFCQGIAKHYRHELGEHKAEIVMLSTSQELLAQFHPAVRAISAKHLRHLGVTLRFGTAVVAVDADGLTLASGEKIVSDTVVWTAGVKPRLPVFAGEAPATAKGRLLVDANLRARGDGTLFALGDAAAYADSPAPMLAQVAVAQAVVVAKNIIARIEKTAAKPFSFRSAGSLVSLGQWYAAGDAFSIRFSGRFAWWLWRTVYLFKFISWKKRLRIAFEWTIGLFSPRDITRLR